jgi:hypothetical protein
MYNADIGDSGPDTEAHENCRLRLPPRTAVWDMPPHRSSRATTAQVADHGTLDSVFVAAARGH